MYYNIVKNNKDLSQNASCYSYINICDPTMKKFNFIFQTSRSHGIYYIGDKYITFYNYMKLGKINFSTGLTYLKIRPTEII